jgi:hypothetical protein
MITPQVSAFRTASLRVLSVRARLILGITRWITKPGSAFSSPSVAMIAIKGAVLHRDGSNIRLLQDVQVAGLILSLLFRMACA